MAIKHFLLFVLTLAGLLYWLLPKTRLASHFRMNETLFVLYFITGIICSAIGLVVTVMYPRFITVKHLWELIILPFILINIYWAIIIRTRGKQDMIDKKQEFDMTRGAALSFAGSIPAMTILYELYKSDICEGTVFFPIFFFQALFFFSAFTLYFYKKA